MKSSGKERRRGRHSKCLIVDGYNIIARLYGSSLASVDNLDAVRDRLIDDLSQYRAFTGEDVIVVFDAHQTSDRAVELEQSGIRVTYTGHHETADARIERFVYELRDIYRQITVATSDASEQQVIFGGGALRVTAGELVRRIRETMRVIERTVDDQKGPARNLLGDAVSQDIANILEKWRRK